MSTEAVLRKLESAMQAQKHYEATGVMPTWAKMSLTNFIRDHGHDLAEVVRDGERIQWLQDTYNQVSPQFPPRPAGSTDALEPTGKWLICIRGTRSGVFANSLREAIDAARGVG